MNYEPTLEVLWHLTHDANRQRWEEFVAEFKDENPFEVSEGALFTIISQYRSLEKNPDFDILAREVKDVETGSGFAARIAIDSLVGYVGDITKFRTALLGVKERYLTRATISSCRRAIEICTSGVKIGQQEYKGFNDAWQMLTDQKQKLSDVDNSSTSSGDIMLEMDTLWAKYCEVREDPSKLGRIPTGVQAIDEVTMGAAGGEFWLVSAFAGEGKSTMLRNMAYFMSMKYGKNIVYASAELTRGQIINQLISRHTYSKKWMDVHEPIPARAIRDGKAAAFFAKKYADLGDQAAKRGQQADEFLKQVMDDMKMGRKSGDYGAMDILQVPAKMTIADLGDYLAIQNRQFHVDAVFVDYATLFAATRKRQDAREEMSQILRDCKMLALNFGTKDQLAVISAHQINRSGRDEAEKMMASKKSRGAVRKAPEDISPYSLRSLAGTAEAERSVDVSVWLLLLERHRKDNLIRVGINKNREGVIPKPFSMRTDFSCSYLGNLTAG